MRRILLLVVPVAALGAGGFYFATRGSSSAAPAASVPPKLDPGQFRTRDGRVITLSTNPTAPAAVVPNDSTPPPPLTPSSSSTSTPVAPPTAANVQAPEAQAAIGAPSQRDRFDQLQHGKHDQLPVPVPGSQKLQKHLGAMANCQGPEYATLTGKARTDYAARCAKVGVTLPP